MKIVLTFMLLFIKTTFAGDMPELPVYVFEIKPHIYQDDNKKIKGIWYDSFEELSRLSGVKFKYQFTSIPRLEILLARNQAGCNFTLLKTKKRVDMGINFIFEHPVKTTFRVYQRADDDRKWTLENLKSDPKVKIVSNTSVATDAMEEKGIKSDLLFNINSIAHMLLYKRIDIFVGSNLAVEQLEEFKSGRIKAGIDIYTLPHGIGCSKATPEEILSLLRKGSKHWVLAH